MGSSRLGLTLGLVLLCSGSSAAGQGDSSSTPLTGWVDMHAHPMARLGFGGKLLHGAPDIGRLTPAQGQALINAAQAVIDALTA